MATKKIKKPTADASPPSILDGLAGKFMPKAEPAERLAAAARTGNHELLAAVRAELGR